MMQAIEMRFSTYSMEVSTIVGSRSLDGILAFAWGTERASGKRKSCSDLLDALPRRPVGVLVPRLPPLLVPIGQFLHDFCDILLFSHGDRTGIEMMVVLFALLGTKSIIF